MRASTRVTKSLRGTRFSTTECYGRPISMDSRKKRRRRPLAPMSAAWRGRLKGADFDELIGRRPRHDELRRRRPRHELGRRRPRRRPRQRLRQ